ncbi:hypothetical protein, partial [Acidiphilium iwatense]|uniref:hypothetical protein n=1 Tax=Acidiphilium iwatense TaxID=768198 RepID=UPI001F206E34
MTDDPPNHTSISTTLTDAIRLFDKAGVRPFSQRNQYNRTLQGPTYNDRHDITGLKQISQV